MKILCDCLGCREEGTWRQLLGNNIVRLCEEHHLILRTKVKKDIDIEYDIDVLKWLLKQPRNHHKVMKYGIVLIGKRVLGSDL